MTHTTIFDCEYLTATGAMNRYWAGPTDPDPLVVQIGAVNLSLEDEFEVLGSLKVYIQPTDRSGRSLALDPFFTELTGIDQEEMDQHAVPLEDALLQFEAFARGASIWSWGKDELYLFGTTCYVAGVVPSIPANRFGNAKSLMIRAGMAADDIAATTSGQLAERFSIPHEAQRHHDALDDALSIALTLQHLLRTGRLSPTDVSL